MADFDGLRTGSGKNPKRENPPYCRRTLAIALSDTGPIGQSAARCAFAFDFAHTGVFLKFETIFPIR